MPLEEAREASLALRDSSHDVAGDSGAGSLAAMMPPSHGGGGMVRPPRQGTLSERTKSSPYKVWVCGGQ